MDKSRSICMGMDDKKESRQFSLWMLLGVGAVLIVLLVANFIFTTVTLDVLVEPPSLTPDAKSTARVQLVPKNRLHFTTPGATVKFRCTVAEGAEKIWFAYNEDSTIVFIHPKGESGRVILSLRAEGFALPIGVTIEIAPPFADADGDGYPDSAELTSQHDRTAFRRWFATIAESQYYVLDEAWQPSERDCAGLIRFACREALRRHDGAWLARRRYLIDANIPDVRRYSYPETPLLGADIFRVRSGNFNQTNLSDSTFSAFAQASLLKEHSFFFSVAG